MNIDDLNEEERAEFLRKHEECEKIRIEFMKRYNEERKACPACGTDAPYTITLVGYIFDCNNPQAYKNRNMCTCECDDRHYFHDRVPLTK